ncbi:hypothetical protein SAMN06265339_1381 [Desulfurobacterium pacificum]|uniref:Uncharacterized protein n=1 Tax=Desulfurobacterium pacificum TaxID=240166 RepID=A0ABY1NQS4_9BACT|nr:hypothetical protein [Desulfurobacterium pacificum]SMP15303.1 hypothetical protein SAMN06265339_1381 [Desulfurobacterium pacificum]
MGYQLLWEIPGIWRELEKLKKLKSEIYRESRSLRGRTVEKMVAFAKEYLGMNERIANSCIKDLNRFVYLLFLGEQYGEDGREFWKGLSLKEQNEFFESFKKILDKANLFCPEKVPGNGKVNLILLHVLVPPRLKNKFVRMAYFIYSRLKGDEEHLYVLEKDKLEELIKKSQYKIQTFIYACQFEETFVPLKKVLREVFSFFNGDSNNYDLPDWLIKALHDYKLQKLKTVKDQTKDNLSNLLKKEDFLFLSIDKKGIRSWKDEKEEILYLSEEPSYLLIKKELYEELDENWLNDWYFPEEKEVNGCKLVRIEDSVEGLEIDGLKIQVEDLGRLIEFEGEDIDFLVPVGGKGKVFSKKFFIKVSPAVKDLLLETPEGIYTLDDLPSHFSRAGIYKVSYRSKKRITQKIYLLPERPKLEKNFNISYKGNFYQLGEKIEEEFGSFKVSHPAIEKLQSGEIYDDVKKKILLPKLPKGIYAYLYNRCGEEIYKFSGEKELDLSQLSPKKLVYPLSLVLYSENRHVKTLTIGRKSRKRKCSLQRILELLLKSSMVRNNGFVSRRLKYKIPRELKEIEKQKIREFLYLSLSETDELGKRFIEFVIKCIKIVDREMKGDRELSLKILKQIKRNIYLRRIVNKYLTIEEE